MSNNFPSLCDVLPRINPTMQTGLFDSVQQGLIERFPNALNVNKEVWPKMIEKTLMTSQFKYLFKNFKLDTGPPALGKLLPPVINLGKSSSGRSK